MTYHIRNVDHVCLYKINSRKKLKEQICTRVGYWKCIFWEVPVGKTITSDQYNMLKSIVNHGS